MADNTNDQPDQKDWFGKMKDFLFAHKALHQVALDSGQPGLVHPADYINQDTSGVAKAAAEAGARNEADKAKQRGANRVQGPQ